MTRYIITTTDGVKTYDADTHVFGDHGVRVLDGEPEEFESDTLVAFIPYVNLIAFEPHDEPRHAGDAE